MHAVSLVQHVVKPLLFLEFFTFNICISCAGERLAAPQRQAPTIKVVCACTKGRMVWEWMASVQDACRYNAVQDTSRAAASRTNAAQHGAGAETAYSTYSVGDVKDEQSEKQRD